MKLAALVLALALTSSAYAVPIQSQADEPVMVYIRSSDTLTIHVNEHAVGATAFNRVYASPTPTPQQTVPEPGTLTLLGSAMAWLGLVVALGRKHG